MGSQKELNKKCKKKDNTALTNTAVISLLSACIMFGAIGTYRLTTQDERPENEPTQTVDTEEKKDSSPDNLTEDMR